MPDVAIILLMLAVLWWGTFCSIYTLKRMHQRCDEIATGPVNGLPVALKYRWLLLFQDYVGVAFALALFCAIVSGWAALAIVVFVVAWVFRLISVLRQTGEE